MARADALKAISAELSLLLSGLLSCLPALMRHGTISMVVQRQQDLAY